jgi:hypothetical protein
MTLYFLPDIIAASTALPNRMFWDTLSYSLSSFVFFFFPIEHYNQRKNTDNNLESLGINCGEKVGEIIADPVLIYHAVYSYALLTFNHQ